MITCVVDYVIDPAKIEDFERFAARTDALDHHIALTTLFEILEVSSRAETPEALAARCGASGHVVDVVPLALLVAAHERSNQLDLVVRRAVSLGGDTDTIASIAGQVAGASVVSCPPP